ncbi:DUF4391 domain-containing protein [Bifidobacterium sp. 82T24]|uniref:DUF4391 domain-containing protein n=1 Tax=Bifidobacterium pluvialisilvae TaxID=2834436 RepID=UPI001C5776D3|nr:DUF4391 domain-containing protein [Bifidobacterium pluvialisilvae]MBW3088077.1 DUF4391 domain-containing protein [Bifidobacterium pluvialisilvae]
MSTGIASCGQVTAVTLGLPSTTAVSASRARLPKEGFYRNTNITARLRQRFVDEVEAFTMLAQISQRSTGIPAGETVTAIYVMGLEQRSDRLPVEIMEHIARSYDEQSRHRARILFVCVRQDICTLAVFRNANVVQGLMEGRVYCGEPMAASRIHIGLDSANMDATWDAICAQLVLGSANPEHVDRRIAAKHKAAELAKEIERLRKAHNRTRQIAKRNELWNKVQELRAELKELGKRK